MKPSSFVVGEPVEPPCATAEQRMREHVAGLAKPVGSLGRLEDLAVWIGACQDACPPRPLERVRCVVPAGDHGVVEAGVTSYPSVLTQVMVKAMVDGGAGVSVFGAQHGVPVRVLDVSVAGDLAALGLDVVSHKLSYGCGSIDREVAMSMELACRALDEGAAIFAEEQSAGLDLLIVGDLGIGNTTPSAALIASILGLGAEYVTGRGAGLDDDGLTRKQAVVQAALDRTVGADPLRRLASLGSPDMAVAVGLMVAASRARTPVLLDGVISVAEALVAETLAPGVTAWFAAGHRSAEPAAGLALASMELDPLLDLGMRLGEGSGAMAAVPLLRSAVAMALEIPLLSDLVD